MSELDAMIATLRKLGKAPADVAKEAAPLVEAVLRENASAGVDPDSGAAWAPKKDGGRAMKNASAAITTKANGDLLVTTLKGPEVFHHYSKKKSEPQRRVIPDGGAGIPKNVAAAIDVAASRVFDRVMGGG